MDMKNKKAFFALLFSLIVSDICSFIRFYIEHDGAKLYNFSIFVCKYTYKGQIINVYNIAATFVILCSLITFFIKLFKKEE